MKYAKQYRFRFVSSRLNDASRTPISLPTFMLIAFFSLVLFFPVTASAQRNDILEVKVLKNEIRNRFSLTERELSRIEPMIDTEGRKLIRMYVRFSGDEPEYSSRVWDQVIEDRSSFEASLISTLSRRQKDALRSARLRMETKVLRCLIDDYTNVLVQALDLNDFQSNDITELYESDCSKKTLLISSRLYDVPRLQTELEYVTETTESKLMRILTEDQWRLFLKMKDSSTQVA